MIDPDGKFTKTVYDAAGNVLKRIDRMGRETSYEYDGAGRLERTIYPDETFAMTDTMRVGRWSGRGRQPSRFTMVLGT